jgi:hypothetical protein
MADGYDNERKGALFKNKNKREGKQDPEYKGSATIGGIEYWVSSWINTSKAGEKYMALSFTPKDPDASRAKAPATVSAGTDPEFDDEIPF